MKTGKLTGRVLAAVCRTGIAVIKKGHQAHVTPQGKQTVKKLMNHRQATNTMPLDGDTRLFDQVARKWKVDYAFHKVGPKKYLVLFKSSQADAMTAAFSEYTRRISRQRQPSILKRLQQFRDRTRTQTHQKERTREAEHGDR